MTLSKYARVFLPLVTLALPLLFTASGCGGTESAGPPTDIGSKKTPDEILREAQAKDAGAAPATTEAPAAK